MTGVITGSESALLADEHEAPPHAPDVTLPSELFLKVFSALPEYLLWPFRQVGRATAQLTDFHLFQSHSMLVWPIVLTNLWEQAFPNTPSQHFLKRVAKLASSTLSSEERKAILDSLSALFSNQSTIPIPRGATDQALFDFILFEQFLLCHLIKRAQSVTVYGDQIGNESESLETESLKLIAEWARLILDTARYKTIERRLLWAVQLLTLTQKISAQLKMPLYGQKEGTQYLKPLLTKHLDFVSKKRAFSIFLACAPFLEFELAKCIAKRFVPTTLPAQAKNEFMAANTLSDLLVNVRRARLIALFPDKLSIIYPQKGVSISAEQDKRDFIAAIFSQNFSHVLRAVQQGVDLNLIDEQGKTPLMFFLSDYPHLDFVLALIAGGANLNQVDEYGFTALLWAISEGVDLNIIKALIQAGADIHLADHDGNSPLMTAMIMRRSEIATLLIKLGANLNRQNNENQTPLMVSVSAPFVEMTYRLLEAGADPNLKCPQGNTALMYAIYETETDPIISILLKHNAMVDAQNLKKETALMLAAERGRHKAVCALVAANAKLELVDNENKMAHEKAKSAAIKTFLNVARQVDQTKALSDVAMILSNHSTFSFLERTALIQRTLLRFHPEAVWGLTAKAKTEEGCAQKLKQFFDKKCKAEKQAKTEIRPVLKSGLPIEGERLFFNPPLCLSPQAMIRTLGNDVSCVSTRTAHRQGAIKTRCASAGA